MSRALVTRIDRRPAMAVRLVSVLGIGATHGAQFKVGGRVRQLPTLDLVRLAAHHPANPSGIRSLLTGCDQGESGLVRSAGDDSGAGAPDLVRVVVGVG